MIYNFEKELSHILIEKSDHPYNDGLNQGKTLLIIKPITLNGIALKIKLMPQTHWTIIKDIDKDNL